MHCPEFFQALQPVYQGHSYIEENKVRYIAGVIPKPVNGFRATVHSEKINRMLQSLQA
jgi:hypothetical protein